MSKLLIRGGHVLDLDLPFEVADVLVEDDRIAVVGPNLPAPEGCAVIEAAGKVVMPGLINCHTHSGQILDRGLADNAPLDLWLVQAAMSWRDLTEEEIYVLTAWSVAVQLKTGCTACLDHAGVRPDRFAVMSDAIMQAYLDSGFRAAVAPSVGDMDFFATLPVHLLPSEMPPNMGRTPPRVPALLSALRAFLRTWKDGCSRLQPYIGPGAPQRCSDGLLDGCFRLSAEFHTGIHTHLLEARSQWFACRERFGCSPVQYFQQRGWLSPKLSCAHGVWVDDADIAVMAETGVCVSHNPVSNLRLGSGIFNLQTALERGLTVALGADGAASNDNQNMWEVVKLTALLHKLYGVRERWIDARQALRLCWEGGRRVLRQPIGAIKQGFQADLVILGGPEVFIRGEKQMVPSLVYGELGQSVETVIVAGKVLYEERRFTRIDEQRLHDRAASILVRGAEQLAELESVNLGRGAYVERLLAACEAMDGPASSAALMRTAEAV